MVEFYLFVNEGDRTYVGSGEITTTGTRKTLNFLLPSKATELQYGGELMGCCILKSEEGFTDTMPVLPGSKEIVYSYIVDYNSGTHTFSRNVNYPTVNYEFLVQGEGIMISSDQLTTGDPLNIDGIQFNHFLGNNFAPGDAVVVKLSGLPETSSQGAVIWAALALIVLVAGSGFVYRLRKRRLQPASPEDSPNQVRQRLLVELAHLDDDFEAGKMPEESYRRLRAERKAQLVELMKGPKEENGNS